jgi:deoxycytidylate deaminase
MPNINSTLISNLFEQAEHSTLQQHLAAAVVQNNKKLSDSVCNADRNLCRGHYTPSLHAEARALLAYYGKNIYYSKYKGWCFWNSEYKSKKVSVVVIRVNRAGNLANARPCRKCLDMMRNLEVKRVHYSSGEHNQIITECVNDMFSIQDSSAARHFARIQYNYPLTDKDYYKFILTKSAPKIIKRTSLEHFIRFNLLDLLPSCKYYFCSINGESYIKIEDNNKYLILIKIM